MPIVITGWRSRVAEEFRALLPEHEVPIWGRPRDREFPVNCARYLFCQGLLRPRRAEDQSDREREEGWRVNYQSIRDACEAIIDASTNARICVIGSESAYRGSFDDVYAAAKRSLHDYVEKKRLRYPTQQIVAISPGIIGDAGMTMRRLDRERLASRRIAHPKGRFLDASEVARMAYTLLYEQDYVSGTVIRMHGGELG